MGRWSNDKELTVESVRERIVRFVVNDLLLGDEARLPSGEASLLEAGVIDSTGILELIEYLESEFGVHVEDNETIPANLDGIDRITNYVERKQSVEV